MFPSTKCFQFLPVLVVKNGSFVLNTLENITSSLKLAPLQVLKNLMHSM